MRYLVIILLFFFSFEGIAQPISYRSNNQITVFDYNLFTGSSFRVPVYKDTIAANAAYTLDSCGKIIFTYTGNLLWYRACSPKRWLQVGGSSSITRAVDTIYRTSGKDSIIFKINGIRYAIKDSIGSVGNFVDTIYRKTGKDSIYYKRNGITYQIKDSVGTGVTKKGYNGLSGTDSIGLGGMLDSNTTTIYGYGNNYLKSKLIISPLKEFELDAINSYIYGLNNLWLKNATPNVGGIKIESVGNEGITLRSDNAPIYHMGKSVWLNPTTNLPITSSGSYMAVFENDTLKRAEFPTPPAFENWNLQRVTDSGSITTNKITIANLQIDSILAFNTDGEANTALDSNNVYRIGNDVRITKGNCPTMPTPYTSATYSICGVGYIPVGGYVVAFLNYCDSNVYFRWRNSKNEIVKEGKRDYYASCYSVSYLDSIFVTNTDTFYVTTYKPDSLGCAYESEKGMVIVETTPTDSVHFYANNTNITLGDTLLLSADQITFDYANYYQWTITATPELGSGIINPTPTWYISNYPVIPTEVGTYTYYLFSTDPDRSCSRLDSITITVYQHPIDSLKRVSDSVFARKNGQWVFQYIDSTNIAIDSLKIIGDSVYARKNGDTSFIYQYTQYTPNLQQVTDQGDSSSHRLIMANLRIDSVPSFQTDSSAYDSLSYGDVYRIGADVRIANASSNPPCNYNIFGTGFTPSTQCGTEVPSCVIDIDTSINKNYSVWWYDTLGNFLAETRTPSYNSPPILGYYYPYPIGVTTYFKFKLYDTLTHCLSNFIIGGTATIIPRYQTYINASKALLNLGDSFNVQPRNSVLETSGYPQYYWSAYPELGSGITNPTLTPTPIPISYWPYLSITPTAYGEFKYVLNTIDTPLGCSFYDTLTILVGAGNTIDSLKRSNDSIYARKNSAWVYQYKNAAASTGTVTSISQGYGIANTPDPITTTGTIKVDTATLSTKYLRIIDTTGKWVTGVTATSPITSSGGTAPVISTSMATNKLIGRYSAGTGVMQEVTIGSGLTLTGAGNLNNTATPTPLGYYGAFQDTINQTAAVINTGYPMKLRLTDLSNQVTIVSESRVTIANTGIYNIQWSAQFTNPTSAEHDVTIWLRKNGVNVAGSSGIVLVPAKHGSFDGHTLPSWNFLLDAVAGDYYEFVWSTANTSVYISYNPAGNPPPSTASVILTVTQQSGIMAGTGITAINSLTGAAQTMVTGTDSSDFKIASAGTTHTFNLPTASATKRGALSSTDWTTFNNKLNISDTAAMLSPYAKTSSLSNLKLASFGTTIDGQGGVIVAASTSYGYVYIPSAGTITGWALNSDVSGSAVIDVKRSGTSIIGGGNSPTLTSASSASASVSGWTSTTVAAGDIIEFVATSATTITRLNVFIKYTKN